jgi:hypothetical protein
MEAHIRSEFELSVHEYKCLLRALQSRFGVRIIEVVAFLSAEQLAAVSDRWEAAAVKRIFEIVTTQIGVEKLYRSRGIVHELDLASDKRHEATEVAVRVDATSLFKNARGRVRRAKLDHNSKKSEAAGMATCQLDQMSVDETV